MLLVTDDTPYMMTGPQGKGMGEGVGKYERVKHFCHQRGESKFVRGQKSIKEVKTVLQSNTNP